MRLWQLCHTPVSYTHLDVYKRQLLDKIRVRPDAQLLQTVLLRSMQQAVYSPDNVGHFGLAYEAYAHFTSPIRRYPDLLIHRAIKAVLNGDKYKAGDWNALGTVSYTHLDVYKRQIYTMLMSC